MQPDKSIKTNKQLLSIEQQCWAAEKMMDLLASCMLNYQLKVNHICPKLFIDMETDEDLNEYNSIVIQLLGED